MRWILLAAALVGLGAVLAPDARAQSGPAAAAKAAANPKFEGSWQGNYSTDGPSGIMSLDLAPGTPWKLVISMGAEAPPPSDPRDLAMDGNKLTWKQAFGEYDVSFVATLNAEGTQITGTLEANQGGSYAGGGSFTLNRKAK
ncbi:MAG: hypothetical protein AB7S39_11905 [Gemmatimonadales bacterium]